MAMKIIIMNIFMNIIGMMIMAPPDMKNHHHAAEAASSLSRAAIPYILAIYTQPDKIVIYRYAALAL